MIATLEGAELLEGANHLALMVADSAIANHYRACKYKLQQDKEAQSLIHRFVVLKEKHEEVQRFGRYHPEFKEVTMAVRDLKRELDLHPTIAAFKKAESQLETLLNEVSQIIAYSVSPQIKVPTGNPFFDGLGGCGVGGACGCH